MILLKYLLLAYDKSPITLKLAMYFFIKVVSAEYTLQMKTEACACVWRAPSASGTRIWTEEGLDSSHVQNLKEKKFSELCSFCLHVATEKYSWSFMFYVVSFESWYFHYASSCTFSLGFIAFKKEQGWD